MNGLTNFTGGRLSRGWVSLILLPIVGNVADLVITVGHSVKKDLDLAISLAFGASVQMALFVIPFLVLYAWIMHKPLTLLFDPFESIILVATSQWCQNLLTLSPSNSYLLHFSVNSRCRG